MLNVSTPAYYQDELGCYLVSSVKEAVASVKPFIGDVSAKIWGDLGKAGSNSSPPTKGATVGEITDIFARGA